MSEWDMLLSVLRLSAMQLQTKTLLLLRFSRNITTTATFASSTWHNHNDIIYSNNQRINNLIKSGYLNIALDLFEEMPHRDVVSFNLVIAAHARHGCPTLAFALFKEMLSQGIRENPSTFSSVLSLCSSNASFLYQQGMQAHCRVIFLGFASNTFVASALIDLYMHIGLPRVALRLSDEMPEKSLATWNLILRGFGELGCVKELLEFFMEMRLDGFEANAVTFCYAIRGCGSVKLINEGKQLHCCAIKLGWVESDLFVTNALVDFYSGCGCLTDARKLFQVLPAEDVISWNSIISVHAEHGFSLEALDLFGKMQSWGKKPSGRAFMAFLKLSSETHHLEFGEQIHCFVLKLGFKEGSIHVQSALIDMYGKCSKIESSVTLFEETPEKYLECCNSLMTALLYCGIGEDVIEMFGFMVDEAVGLDEVTLSTTLKALSSSASVSLLNFRLVHSCVIKSGFESSDVVLCSLIDAYSRCGHTKFSRKIFEQILDPNLICFTSMISGYARSGMGKEGLEMLELLTERDKKPDAITFLSVLTGCSHSGLVEEGLSVFKSMEAVHRIKPDRRHYSCMVDLLGRAGWLEEAEELLKLEDIEGDSVIWSSMLQSCRTHRNEKVGKRAAKALMELQPKDPAAFLQASAFYSEIGDMETATKIKETRMSMNMKREFGYSLIEINNPLS